MKSILNFVKVLSSIIDEQMRTLAKQAAYVVNTTHYKKNEYGPIPVDTESILFLLSKAKPYFRKKIRQFNFIDVGCGFGNVCTIADAFATAANYPCVCFGGMDKHLPLLIITSENLRSKGRSFAQSWIDFNDKEPEIKMALNSIFKQFRNVYFFRGISDSEIQNVVYTSLIFNDCELQSRLEKIIIENVPVGTILLFPYSGSTYFRGYYNEVTFKSKKLAFTPNSTLKICDGFKVLKRVK